MADDDDQRAAARPGVAQSIHDRIRGQIARGELRPGDRLASLREHAGAHGCAVQTVVQAYEMLVAAGLVEARHGSGFYVAGDRPIPLSLERFTPAVEMALQGLGMSMGETGELDLSASPAVGLPPSSWLEACRLDRYLPKLARGGIGTAFRPGDPRGYPPLRERIAQRLRSLDIDVPAGQVLLTQGAHQAMDLVLRAFVRPGDGVLIDDPGFYQTYRKLALHGAMAVPVPRTADGLDVDHLERCVERSGARVFFTQSLSHNPTGTDISREAGEALRRVCERTGLLVVDDDALSDYRPASIRRFPATDRLAHSLYIGTFTKSISNVIRVGYVATTPERAARLLQVKIASVLNTSQLTERMVDVIIGEKRFDRHLARLRSRLEAATASTTTALLGIGAELFAKPHASLYLWARLPGIEDSLALAQYAAAHGVGLAPGALFRPAASGPTAWMRFNTSTTGDASVIAGLRDRYLGQLPLIG